MKTSKNDSMVVATGIFVIMILPFAMLILAFVALFGYGDKFQKMIFPNKSTEED